MNLVTLGHGIKLRNLVLMVSMQPLTLLSNCRSVISEPGQMGRVSNPLAVIYHQEADRYIPGGKEFRLGRIQTVSDQ